MTLGHIPFKVIHLLWANLVMDVLGAIALATEPPKDVTMITRVRSSDKIIRPDMWRTIIVQSIYQLLVMFIL
jgi:magnesium-transporting ATPase (P-type)